MRRLVYECLLENAVGYVELSLAGVDEKIVIPTAEGVDPFVNPDGLHVDPQCGWQLAYGPPVFLCFLQGGVGVAEFGIDLNLAGQSVVKGRVEEVCVDIDPATGAPVEHGARFPARVGEGLKRSRVRGGDDIRIDKYRAPERWLRLRGLVGKGAAAGADKPDAVVSFH